MIFKLTGVVQHYAWGGYKYIPNLLKKENTSIAPWAEYWLGTHPKGTSTVEVGDKKLNLSEALKQNLGFLGIETAEKFGELPFLFKILDVRQMLSIQLHPTKANAELGFAKEEAEGIPRLAANRNYKDKNHKPEVMVALSDFWLLHGFKNEEDITAILHHIPLWIELLPPLEEGGIKALYEAVMSMPQEEIDRLLSPLFVLLKTEKHSKNNPNYWAWQAFENYTRDGHYDRGVFSIYFFNLVYLQKGQGIFQGPGIPHAYLEGVNIELMANSDNVLRGGLTPKHIDVMELLANVDTTPVVPFILQEQIDQNGVCNYPVPADDFSLDKIKLTAGKAINVQQKGPAIYLVIEGSITANGTVYQSGESFFAIDGSTSELKNDQSDLAIVFRAYV